MSPKRYDPRDLRRLARDTIEKIAADAFFPDSEWEDLTTSLVRQWQTYDNKAILFADQNRELRLSAVDNPRGEIDCAIEWKKAGWPAFIRDWRFDPDDVPDILYRLNRGQGTEVIDSEGRPLRIFVDPKEGKKGVESEVKKEGALPDAKTRYEKLAADMVDEQLEGEMEIVVKDDLVRSIAEQWRRYGGHACIFMDERRQLSLELTERPDGSNIRAVKRVHDPRPLLHSLGFQPWEVWDALARINAGEEVAFADRQGNPAFLSHDPKSIRFVVRKPNVARPRLTAAAPLFCPRCTAVLRPWASNQPQQTCPICGETVAGAAESANQGS